MNKQPFAKFGTQLKQLRQRAKETVADVSGAVELDTKQLSDIEAGKTQPSEDIVLLLISHFALTEEEAIKLWELSGHKENIDGSQKNSSTDSTHAFISMADAKIIYTDMVHINANKYGVVMDFLQGLGAHNQPVAISRIGMSRDHAKSLLKVLQQTLKSSEKSNKTDTPRR